MYECGMLMKQIADSIETIGNAHFKKHGITLSQLRFIAYVAHQNRNVPLKEFESVFEVSQPTVVGIVQRLKQKELVLVHQSKQDNRIKEVALTKKGQEIFAKAEKSRDEMERELLSPLDEEERMNFTNSLRMINENLKKYVLPMKEEEKDRN